MAARPVLPLPLANLSPVTDEVLAAIVSPARGKEMRANLLAKLRPPPLVHQWEFWHDRQDRKESTVPTPEDPSTYENRLVRLCAVTDVREFWELFNNFDVSKLPLRDTIHLFHKGVKPLWEDPRNVRGGSWTFRVPKDKAREFWKEICMMAIGEQLQSAVASKRITFLDDICGISYSVRFTSILINIWNRDADHFNGVQNILRVVLTCLPPELFPRENSYYYKRHSEHAGFHAPPPDMNGARRATIDVGKMEPTTPGSFVRQRAMLSAGSRRASQVSEVSERLQQVKIGEAKKPEVVKEGKVVEVGEAVKKEVQTIG